MKRLHMQMRLQMCMRSHCKCNAYDQHIYIHNYSYMFPVAPPPRSAQC